MAFRREGPAASPCRSSARAVRRSANGTRRSTCARSVGCRRSSASRTIRRRCRRRSRINRRSACSPTRRRATAFRESRSTAPIPMRLRRRLPGQPSARASGTGPDARSSSSRCACAATLITTTCCTSAAIRSRPGNIALLRNRAMRIVTCYAFWAARDPIPTYAARLEREGVIAAGDLDRFKDEAEAVVERAGPRHHRSAVAGPRVGRRRRVRGRTPARACGDARSRDHGSRQEHFNDDETRAWARRSIRRAARFWTAIMLGLADALRSRSAGLRVWRGRRPGRTATRSCCFGRCSEFGDRIINSPLAEGAVLGVCVGAALAGQRPIGEIQFNDFVATGFNQLVNNAAKIRYRWGGSVPMVVRMPWGGLRHAGPYHSQNTEAWFYRTPGPEDRRAVDAARRAGAVGVRRRRSGSGSLSTNTSRSIAIRASSRRLAMRRRSRFRSAAPRCGGRATTSRSSPTARTCTCALRVAERLAQRRHRGQRARSPHPRPARSRRRCWRWRAAVTGCSSSTRTRGPAASARASPRLIQEEAFESLDAPVRIVGALDTPVPYSPPLEEFYLPSEAQIERAARLLVAYYSRAAMCRREASEKMAGAAIMSGRARRYSQMSIRQFDRAPRRRFHPRDRRRGPRRPANTAGAWRPAFRPSRTAICTSATPSRSA